MRIEKERVFEMVRRPAFWQFLCMMAGGGVSVMAANTWDKPYFVEIPGKEVPGKWEENLFLDRAMEAGETFEAAAREEKETEFFLDGAGDDVAGKLEKIEEELPGRFNFAFYFDEGTGTEDGSLSYGGRAYRELLQKDSSWMAGIYGLRHVSPEAMASRLGLDKSAVMGTRHLNGSLVDGAGAQVIPSWNRFQVTFRNGDGTAVMGHSNIKEILSIASVYGYFNQEDSYDFIKSYTGRLWDMSHSYKISVSDVYYCRGECLYGEDQEEEESGIYGASPLQVLGDGQSASGVAAQDGGSASCGGDEISPASQETTGQVSHEPIPVQESTGQVSHEPISVQESTGQVSHEPIPIQESTGQVSHEPIPVSESTGQVSHEPIPVQESTGQVSHEPIPVSESTGQVSHEPIPVQESTAQVSHESIPEVQDSSQASAEMLPAAAVLGETSREDASAALAAAEAGQSAGAAGKAGEEVSRESQAAGAAGGSGQVSHEPIPESQEAVSSQEEGAAVSQGILASGESKASSGEGGDIRQREGSQEPAKAASDAAKYCHGHIDLKVSAVVLGMDGKKSLFTLAAQQPENGNNGGAKDRGWNGWGDETQGFARDIAKQDWYEQYGLTGQETMFIHDPLSGSEVASYMNMLPEDTSQKRRTVVEEALLSIGCIPYYWGGKPSGGGFDSNHFGVVVSPDEDGRILRGLDCSGWINWVYWTALGSPLPAESTSGLMGCGRAVEKKDLKAGDILIRAGSQPHVYLFLAWAEGGSMYLIHETTGNVNNVTIGVYDLDLPYYRCLINEE